jgi:cytoskeleton protein RodZ
MYYGKSSPVPNKPMETLGGFFQHARERQGLSLDQVAVQTRIQPRHLLALEEEDFTNLPAKVFTKGFVRSYARTLGLDEEEALQLFLVSSSSFYERTEQEQPSVQIKLEAAHRRRWNWNLIWIFILIIGGAIFFLLPEQQKTPQLPIESQPLLSVDSIQELQHTPGELPPGGSPMTPVEKTEPPPSPASPITPPTAIPESHAIGPSLSNSPPHSENVQKPGGTLVLEIEATQLTWVVVKSDDQAPHEALLQPGQQLTWKAKDQFLLTLGNAAGVVIRLNGESRGPFGKPGEVVRNISLKS